MFVNVLFCDLFKLCWKISPYGQVSCAPTRNYYTNQTLWGVFGGLYTYLDGKPDDDGDDDDVASRSVFVRNSPMSCVCVCVLCGV